MISNNHMFTKYFVFLLTLWSCQSFAGFSTLDTSWATDKNSLVEIKNMPRLRSQDSVPDCWGFSSATIAQYNICNRPNPPKVCSELGPKQEISPLSMVGWTHTNNLKDGVPEIRNHKNIQFGIEGATAAKALMTAKNEFIFMAESCYPHDQLATQYGIYQEDVVKNILENLKKKYEEFNKQKTEGNFCEECYVKSVEQEALKLKINAPIEDIKSALKGKKTFGEFLYRITLGRCEDMVQAEPSPNFSMYPPAQNRYPPAKELYNDMISKVKDVLKTGNPLAFDGICIKLEKGKCAPAHSVVISGYRKVCKAGNCRDVLRIQNSWGADWQEKHDNGWIDAEDLLSDVVNNPQLIKNTLAWYH